MTTESPADGRLARGIPKLQESLKEEILKRVFVGGIVMTGLAFALLPGRSATGVAAGALISALSFRDLKVTLERLFLGMLSGDSRGPAVLLVRHYLKVVLTFIVLAAVLKSGRVDVFGLAVGLFLVPAVMIYTGLLLHFGKTGGKV